MEVSKTRVTTARNVSLVETEIMSDVSVIRGEGSYKTPTLRRSQQPRGIRDHQHYGKRSSPSMFTRYQRCLPSCDPYRLVLQAMGTKAGSLFHPF